MGGGNVNKRFDLESLERKSREIIFDLSILYIVSQIYINIIVSLDEEHYIYKLMMKKILSIRDAPNIFLITVSSFILFFFYKIIYIFVIFFSFEIERILNEKKLKTAFFNKQKV